MNLDEFDAVGGFVVTTARWVADHVRDIGDIVRIIDTLAKWLMAIFDSVTPSHQTIGMESIPSTSQVFAPGVVYGRASLVVTATSTAVGSVVAGGPRC